MKISVIIPTFNNEDHIVDALDSVMNQTCLNLIQEVIVVNDGSTDKTVEKVKKYIDSNNKIKVKLIDQSNQGVSVARNNGMKVACGDWIALLDADDVWLPEKIAIQLGYIEKDKDIDFIGGNHCDKPLRILWRKIERVYQASIYDLCIKWFPVTPSVMFKKQVFLETGGFNEKMKHSEDAEFFAKVSMRYNFFYIPEKVVAIGHGKSQFGEKGLSADLKSMYKGNIDIFRNLKKTGVLSTPRYFFIRLFAYLKYIRRILIVSYRK